MFDGMPSPSTSRTLNREGNAGFKSVLDFNDRSTCIQCSLDQRPQLFSVPVYDGRAWNFSFARFFQYFSERFKSNMSSKGKPVSKNAFKEWEGEVPAGSFAMVGYTVSTFTNSSGLKSVSCNIQFVIVVGTPPE